MFTRSMLDGALASGWFGAGLPETARARLADLAELFGRSLRERAVALIGIAHPDARDRLLAEAEGLHLI